MPKAIIDIDLNDAKFKDFVQFYRKFKDEAENTSGLFGGGSKGPFKPGSYKAGQEVKGGLAFGDMVAALTAQAVMLKKMEDSEKAQTTQVERQGRSWKGMVDTTKKVAHNLSDATKSLLRWTSITGVISGLLGAGGLWGLDRLADNVAFTRKSALGLGTSFGEQKSFELNYGQFIEPGQFLGGVNQALHDLSSRIGLLSVGVPQSLLQTNNAAAVGSDLLGRLKTLADSTNPAVYQQAIDARHLGGVVTPADLERLHLMSRRDIELQQKKYTQDSKNLQLDYKTQKAWNDMSIQLERAKLKIETALVRGLEPLTPALSHLSDAVAGAITHILGSIKPETIDRIGKGIDDFAKYLTSPEFKQGATEFVHDIGELAKAIVDALHKMGKHAFADTAVGAGVGNVVGNFIPLPGGKILGTAAGAYAGYVVGDTRDYAERQQLYQQFYSPKTNFEKRFYVSEKPILDEFEHSKGLPSGLLSGIYGAETSFGRNVKTSSAGAIGPFQLMPRTADKLGVNPRDFVSSAKGASDLLSELLQHYNGDTQKAIAGYNLHPGDLNGKHGLDWIIAHHPKDWQKHLPKETGDYLKKVEALLRKMDTNPVYNPGSGPRGDYVQSPSAGEMNKLTKVLKQAKTTKAHVVVQNNTGGNAIVLGNQAAN